MDQVYRRSKHAVVKITTSVQTTIKRKRGDQRKLR